MCFKPVFAVTLLLATFAAANASTMHSISFADTPLPGAASVDARAIGHDSDRQTITSSEGLPTPQAFSLPNAEVPHKPPALLVLAVGVFALGVLLRKRYV